ncbi:ABC transporter substrate-binding protein [Marinicrinis lubricantis]|uniref:ABC transporter substrate-binding protein n=1 Tax=Marinicrinis lubricantis TaxID=2086470 RepID=A0ABW1IQE4_9BACL
MQHMKKLFSVVLVVVLAFSLAACAGNSNNGNNTDPGNSSANEPSNNTGNATTNNDAGDGSDQEEVTIRLLWWGSQTRHDLTLEAIKLYEENNPHVTIEPEFTGWSGYWEKLAAMVAGNNMPDVFAITVGEYLSQYAGKNLLADFGPFVDSGLIDLSNTSESLIQSGEVNGTLYGIPLGMNALTVIYDEQMIKDAGATPPSNDWTWEDWKSIAEDVHGSTGQYGTQALDVANMFTYYARQHDQKLYNPEGTGLGHDDQTLADFFSMVLEQQEKGTYPTLDVVLQHEAVEDQLIIHKKAPFDFRWSNQVIALTNAAQRPLKLDPLPGPDHDKGAYLNPSMFFSISESSKVKEEAAKFINWWTNDIEANKILNGERGVPISSVVRDALMPNLDETNQMVYEYINYVSEHSSPIDTVVPPGAAEIESALSEVHEQVMYKQLTPEEGAAEYRKRAEEIIERNS